MSFFYTWAFSSFPCHLSNVCWHVLSVLFSFQFSLSLWVPSLEQSSPFLVEVWKTINTHVESTVLNGISQGVKEKVSGSPLPASFSCSYLTNGSKTFHF